MKIKHALRGIASALAAASLALVLAPGVALATEYEAVTVEVTGHVDVTLTGDESVTAPDEEFTVVLVDEDTGETVATTTAAGGESFVLATEVSNQVGEYKYTLYQLSGTTEGMTYDAQVYEVVVYILWDSDVDELYGIVYVFNDEGYKLVDPGFENEYYVEVEVVVPEEEVPQTGDSLSLATLWAVVICGVCLVGAGVVLAARWRRDAADASLDSSEEM